MSQPAGQTAAGSAAIVRLSPAEVQLAIAGVRVLLEVVNCASDVVKLHARTVQFVREVDALVGVLETDGMQVWRVVQPLTELLLRDTSLDTHSRMMVLNAIQALSEPSVRARADAIRSVAARIA